MDDLFEKFAERLTISEVSSISKGFVSKPIKACKDLAWVTVANNLLKRINKQTDVNYVHNVFLFIEITAKVQVKNCNSASAKLNRKLCLQISDLLSYIHCIADKDLYPSFSMSVLDISSLKATLLAALIDMQVKGVRSGDENALVTDLYSKLKTMFESSWEILCDCLLLCRCVVYKKQRKPSVLIPLLRRVILYSASRNGRFRCTSPIHYIKLLLLAKILLFMVETNEVLAVHSLVVRTLKVPDFFRDWLEQNNIPWLSQIDKNHISAKNILKCMTVSTVMKTLYGTNKVTCGILTNINHAKHTDAPQVEKDKLGMRDFLIITKKKSNKQTSMDKDKLDDLLFSKTKKKEVLGNSSSKKLQNDKVNNEINKNNTKDEEKGLQDSVKSNMELNGLTTIFNHNSLNWSSPNDKLTKRKMNSSSLDLKKGLKRSLLKEEIINHRKRVRRDSLTFSVTKVLEENITPAKQEVKRILIQKNGICTKKVSIGIQTEDCLLNESEFDAEIQNTVTESTVKSVKIDKDSKILKPKIDLPRNYRKSKMAISNEVNVVQIGNLLNHHEKDNSPEVNELDYSSSQNINEVTGENPLYERQMVKEKKGKETKIQPIAQAAQMSEENNVQYQMKKLSIIDKEISAPENMIKNFIKTAENDEILSKFDINETELYTKENKTETISNIENLGDLHVKTNGSQIQNFELRILLDEKESEIEMQSLNHDSVVGQCNLKETISENRMKSMSNESNVKHESKEEVMKSAKIEIDKSEGIYNEIIINRNVNTQINCVYKGSNLKENAADKQKTKATQNEVFSYNEKCKNLINCQELGKNRVLAELQIEKINITEKDVVDTQVNKDNSILTKDKIYIAENEELEVLSTSGVNGNYVDNVSTSFCVTGLRDNFPASPHQVSNDNSHIDCKSSSQCLMISQVQEKIVRDAIPAMKQESQELFKAHTIAQIVPCNLKNQSQMKVNGTSSLINAEDSQRQDFTKNISKENNQNKKQTTDMNDLIKNKVNKTDKKNEKLKVGENYGRINYLVQASRKVFNNDESISSQLGSLAISFGRRLPQVRLDPLLKREMCKGCGVYLVYGVNAKVRHKSKRQKHLVITCLTCHTIKRFVTNPDHKLWSEQSEAKV